MDKRVGKRTSARILVRQLCLLGVPSEIVMFSLIAALREVVPSEMAGFLWLDEEGRITNRFADRLLAEESRPLSFEAVSICRRAIELKLSSRPASRSVTHRPTDSSPLLGMGPTRHALYVSVGDGGRPVGQLCMYRSEIAGPFTLTERAELEGIAHYLARALLAQATPEEETVYEDTPDGATLVATFGGAITLACRKATHLALLASTDHFDSEDRLLLHEHISSFALEIQSAMEISDGVALLQRRTRWGRFSISACVLDDGSNTVHQDQVAVTIRRQEPRILKFVRSIAEASLSPQQCEIALLLAKGASTPSIGATLGLSNNTVAYHLKQLFQRFGAHDRLEVVDRIAGVGSHTYWRPHATHQVTERRRARITRWERCS